MMNPFQIISAIKGGGNPQQMVMNMMQNIGSTNPMVGNIMSMARQGNAKGIEQFARNICNERGVSFDEAFANFRRQNGI